MESLHTSGETESAASSEPTNGADVSSPSLRAAAADGSREPEPPAETAADGSREPEPPAETAADGSREPVPPAETAAAGGPAGAEAVSAEGTAGLADGRGAAGDGDGGAAATGVTEDGADCVSPATGAEGRSDSLLAVKDSSRGEPSISTSSGSSASVAPNTAGGAADVTGGRDGAVGGVAVPPPGPYLELETESVVVRSEPLVSLYYNPQSSTAGQISVESPQSGPTPLARPPDPEPCRTTFAER